MFLITTVRPDPVVLKLSNFTVNCFFPRQDTPPPTLDKSLYYSGSITGGVVNPAYATASPYKRFTSPYKRKQDPDKISDESMFDDDYNEDDEYYLWDRNQDSGLVSAVSLIKVLNFQMPKILMYIPYNSHKLAC